MRCAFASMRCALPFFDVSGLCRLMQGQGLGSGLGVRGKGLGFRGSGKVLG